MLYNILRFFKIYLIKPVLKPINNLKKNLSYKNNFNELKKYVNVRTLIPAKGELRKQQLCFLEFAKEISGICEEVDIHPFMLSGTLLGAERHGGFIPWDDDFDFGLMRKDYEKLKNIAKEKFIYITLPKDRLYMYFNSEQFLKNLFKEYPNKILFVQLTDAIHVVRGNSDEHYDKVDFFSLDYYANEYTYQEHLKYLDKVWNKLFWKNDFKAEYKFLSDEINRNPNIVEYSNQIAWGIDNPGSYIDWQKNGWWEHKDFFPLKKLKFEDTEFWAPNNHIKVLDYWCKNWRGIPDDVFPKMRRDYE